MGWSHDDGTHEGYLVAIVGDRDGWFLGAMSSRAVELGNRNDAASNTPAIYVQRVKAACSCGWRSPMLRAPSGTHWLPNTVCAPGWFDDAARALWLNHVDSCGPVPDGGMDLT